ncbi:MAG: patatin-like phospholipase family protein [Acidobacteria bacterium]|nr:patatin-like phospholipase family protein [Acidobacteriota bacterium]
MKALIFSAGGAFGAYQAGVWQALEERGFRPDIVAGASIGAINATAVSRGATGAQLQQWWRDPASDVFRWNWPPRGWGLLASRPLEARIRKLLETLPQASPGLRLLVTLTELPGTAIRVVAGENVTAQHLLASCAIPVVFPAVRIEGRWYWDGGVFCRLPIGPAVEAGATEIIAVDLLAAPPSRPARGLLNAAIRTRRLLRGEKEETPPPRVKVRVIASRQPLGSLRDLLRWDASNVQRWIEQGYRDAQQQADFRDFARLTP